MSKLSNITFLNSNLDSLSVMRCFGYNSIEIEKLTFETHFANAVKIAVAKNDRRVECRR